MKFFKYISLFVAGFVALTSWRDNNDDYAVNTAAGVGVSVETSEMVVNEIKGIFNIPIVLTGEPNGYVKVKVKIVGTDDPDQDQAIADNHFYLTSEYINIPADTKTANIELRTQALDSRDPDLYFRVVIERAEGATIEPLNTCTVTIVDQMSSPIYSLAGAWELSFKDYDGAAIVTPRSELKVVNEETGRCQFEAFYPALYSGLVLNVDIREDPASGEYKMSIPYGTTAASGLNFTGLGVCDVLITDTNGSLKGSNVGTWNDDHTVVTFSQGLLLAVYSEGVNQGLWDRLTGLSFKKLD